MTLFITLTLIFGTMGLAYYLDARYDWQVVSWLNGQASSPFSPDTQKARSTEQAEITALKARIETLETIVTDQSYELNQKLNRL
ncbi:hypothetical protein [Salinimonas chungwhensis]|jgi:hypothetical protein|uniref:hypothetical protein n=1 Tax=Salinimonas chungwhensis TaxID=265425 RepID=UPI0003671566|nr:hypothetical protein [Salinimonas chungwhensis]